MEDVFRQRTDVFETLEDIFTLATPALRRVGLGHLAGGDSPRGSPWNGCAWAAETLNGVVNHARVIWNGSQYALF